MRNKSCEGSERHEQTKESRTTKFEQSNSDPLIRILGAKEPLRTVRGVAVQKTMVVEQLGIEDKSLLLFF